MFNFFKSNAKDNGCHEKAQIVSALYQVQAIIEFEPNGTILHANELFLSTVGYSLMEIQGRHHRMFVDNEEQKSSEYSHFWARLAAGESHQAVFKRLDKHGKTVWLQASYNPLRDEQGRVYKVIKFAQDISKTRNQANLAAALKTCQANVMIADMDLSIVYMNDAVTHMLKARETQLKSALPKFSVANLIGTNVDVFHESPTHQRALIGKITEPYHTQIKVAGLTFTLIATPWYDDAGVHLGTLVEWQDKTDELAKQEEEQRMAAENARIRQALDVCDTSVMLADNDFNIIYMNTSVKQMMEKNERDIKTALPGFNAAKLIGGSIDQFHKNPHHQRKMLETMQTEFRTDIKISGLTFGLIATPIFVDGGKRLGTVVEWEDKTEQLAKQQAEQSIAAENARIRQALDNVSANVMIADDDANIIYLNSAVSSMMKNAEADLRKALPNFDASRLLGVNMDVFHKNPSHQRDVMKNLRSTYHGKAEVAGRTFTVVANPVMQGEKRIGTVVEWADRTAEVAMEREIDTMITAASVGDFTKQISLDGKDGFFGNISKGLNTLVSTVEIALNDMLRMLGAMARGNLSERITREYSGSFGQLRTDANSTADKLTEIISKIRQSAGSIHSAASEIAQGNADLSQRTEEQASSLEETASSMEEMTSTVRQSAENAQKANELAMQAQGKAQIGGQVVSRAVQAMEDINAASKKIADIISVIDEIAFQTNLLALNAAVEAARAGEQGRGFAVVAGEVRNLAQRSAGAAKEIKELIRDSVMKVQDGRELVNESGKTLGEIVSAVEVVCQMMRDIASAAREQTAGIEQVNTAVSQMDEMTQQNAALVEEATAASQSMVDQANDMGQLVSFFNVGQTTSAAMGNSYNAPRHQATKTVAKKAKLAKPMRSAAPSSSDEWEDF
ncbi:MAG TPA: methyl-accepting chemotaxis protein [Cellvibrionaceae bacterium]